MVDIVGSSPTSDANIERHKMQKEVQISSVDDGELFYRDGIKYKLNRFNEYFLGVNVETNLIRLFYSTNLVMIDTKYVDLKSIPKGTKFTRLGSDIVYTKSDRYPYNGCIAAIYEDYKIIDLVAYEQVLPVKN